MGVYQVFLASPEKLDSLVGACPHGKPDNSVPVPKWTAFGQSWAQFDQTWLRMWHESSD
jgi:hypothetical protein